MSNFERAFEREIPQLKTLLVNAVRTVQLAERLANATGIAPGTFPTQYNDMSGLFDQLLPVLSRQGKLRTLVQVAADAPEILGSMQAIAALGLAMDLQSDLIDCVDACKLDFEIVAFEYLKSLPLGALPEQIRTFEELVQHLWHLPDKSGLFAFCVRLGHKTEVPAARQRLAAWRTSPSTLAASGLSAAEVAEIEAQIQPPVTGQASVTTHYLMIVVQQASARSTKFTVRSLLGEETGADGRAKNSESPAWETNDAQPEYGELEQVIKDLIDESLVLYQPSTIELYLPSSLLSLLAVDTWDIRGRPLPLDVLVVNSILDRHEANERLRWLQSFDDGNLKKAKAREIKQNTPEVWNLISACNRWASKWSHLAEQAGHPAGALAVFAEENGQQSPSQSDSAHDTCTCMVFTFSPQLLQRDQFGALLRQPLTAGMPIVLWPNGLAARELGGQPSEPLGARLRQWLGETPLALPHAIGSLVQDIRLGRKGGPGYSLTLIVDNPNRSIPSLETVRM